MALYPCDRCGQRYRGPQQTIYPAFLNGTHREGGRVRVCPPCLDEVVSLPWLLPAEMDFRGDREGCYACGGHDAEVAVFITVYATNSERADLFGRLGQKCCRPACQDAVCGASEAREGPD